MIVHLVLGKARPHLSAYQEQELSEALSSLQRVPPVLEMSWGTNFSGRSDYTHAAVIHLADRAALAAYLANDEHRKIVQTLDRLLPERVVVDYETGTSGISR